ncbi:copper resistance protein CopC [Microbacterium sp. Gd 4-13]|nr:copper resistance protein CopC [Microbacterium sp. Gd 4-13]
MNERSTLLFRVRTVAAGMAVAAVALLATASPASAHDELLSSTPSSGERLLAAPSEVTLTFSADVLDMGAAIVVADADGQDWAAGESAVVEGSVTVEVQPGMADAGYEVRWRVVSSDGHPISGIIPFTVGDGEPLVRDAAAESSSESDAAGTTGVDTTASQTTSQGQGAFRVALIGGAGAAIALGVLAVFLLLRRRATAAGTDDSAS